MKKLYAGILVGVFSVLGLSVSGFALPTQVIDLGDTTVEHVKTGYSGDPELENLEYWFEKNGLTNTDGSNIDPLDDQRQEELFYTGETKTYEIEFLGIGYASYHSDFGYFTYDGDPYGTFDSSKMNYHDVLFTQNEVAENSVFEFTVEADSFFGFYLDSNGQYAKTGDAKYLLTTMVDANYNPTSNHVDNKDQYETGYDHALFFETNKGYTMAFEDIAGGGDADHEDLVVNFRSTDGSQFTTVPEPTTVLLFGVGLLGLFGISRQKRTPQR